MKVGSDFEVFLPNIIKKRAIRPGLITCLGNGSSSGQRCVITPNLDWYLGICLMIHVSISTNCIWKCRLRNDRPFIPTKIRYHVLHMTKKNCWIIVQKPWRRAQTFLSQPYTIYLLFELGFQIMIRHWTIPDTILASVNNRIYRINFPLAMTIYHPCFNIAVERWPIRKPIYHSTMRLVLNHETLRWLIQCKTSSSFQHSKKLSTVDIYIYVYIYIYICIYIIFLLQYRRLRFLA